MNLKKFDTLEQQQFLKNQLKSSIPSCTVSKPPDTDVQSNRHSSSHTVNPSSSKLVQRISCSPKNVCTHSVSTPPAKKLLCEIFQARNVERKRSLNSLENLLVSNIASKSRTTPEDRKLISPSSQDSDECESSKISVEEMEVDNIINEVIFVLVFEIYDDEVTVNFLNLENYTLQFFYKNF